MATPYILLDENLPLIYNQATRSDNDTCIVWGLPNFCFCNFIVYTKTNKSFHLTLYYNISSLTNVSDYNTNQSNMFISASMLAKSFSLEGACTFKEITTFDKHEMVIETPFAEYVLMILFGVTHEQLTRIEKSIFYNPIYKFVFDSKYDNQQIQQWKMENNPSRDAMVRCKVNYFDALNSDCDSILNIKEQSAAKIDVIISMYEYFLEIPDFIFRYDSFRLKALCNIQKFNPNLIEISNTKRRRLRKIMEVFTAVFDVKN